MKRQAAEHMVERLAERVGVDVADHRDHQLVAGEDAGGIVPEVIGSDGGDGTHGALDRPPVRMVLKGKTVPGERGHRLRVVLVEFKPGQDLGAHALDRVLIEAGLGKRKPHEIEHLILVG